MKHLVILPVLAVLLLAPVFVFAQQNVGIGTTSPNANAILDINCRIGNNVVIRGGTHLTDIETETYSVVDGIIVLKKSVVIPAGSRIGDV